MEPLKEMFGLVFYRKLAQAFGNVYPSFDEGKFLKEVLEPLASLSLNQRMRHTSHVLHNQLSTDYRKSIDMMKEVVVQLQGGYTNLLFPDYVSVYGSAHFETSMDALHYFTKFGSSEFAIRVFLQTHFELTLQQMTKWSEDENYHVRRLSSEGSRPRLPWSFKLDAIIQRPELTKPILENLKHDQELYVRKSVANHLNDITKDSPDYVVKLVKSWDQSHPHTAWIVKRGCRSLLKQGDKKSMALFNLTKDVKVTIKKFMLQSASLRLNDMLSFQFTIVSGKNSPQRLMIDYRIHYAKKSGVQLPKVFKLKELTLQAGESVSITKKQRFQDFTTRKLVSGKHLLEIVINGEVVGRKKFVLSR